MKFQFSTAHQIIFGRGSLLIVGERAKEYGDRALVVAGRRINRIAPLLEQLHVNRVAYVLAQTSGEPTTDSIDAILRTARETQVDLIISMGGGSVIDAGKAAAALLTNPGDVLDYLEVIGEGKPLANDPLPHIAIPTTAGTGTEVTKNAVLRSIEHNVKVSLRHNKMIPNEAIIDPTLTASMPPAITAATGMDAMTQLIEPFVSRMANPLTDAICREGMMRAGRSLKRAYDKGDDMNAREEMALASLFGGLALANAKLGAVHGFAGPIGGIIDAPHGAVCARLLPLIMQANIKALRQLDPTSPILIKYDEIARLLTGTPKATAENGVEWIYDLNRHLHIPGLAHYGMKKEHIEVLIPKARKASSMKGNPVQLQDAELAEILNKAL